MVLMRPFNCPVKVSQSEDFAVNSAEIIDDRTWALITSPSWVSKMIDERLAKVCGAPRAVIANVKPNPCLSDILELAALLPEVDVIVALGGGSVLDAAKGIAAVCGLPNGEQELVTHLTQGTPLPDSLSPAPIIAIPTTSGTGSEVTSWGTIWGDDGIKFSVNDRKLYPAHAILDASLCLSMPHELTLFTALDALSHAMESVWNKRHSSLTDAMSTQAISIIYSTLDTVLEEPSNIDARQRLQAGATIAGLAMGTTQTALAHSISYPFTSKFNVPHGLACSFSLGEIARFNGELDLDRLRPIADGLNCEPCEVADTIDAWFSRLGILGLLLDYVSPEMVEELGDNIITRARAANNIRDVDGPTARTLARTAMQRHESGPIFSMAINN